jgi:hypothetical protein
MMVGTALIFVGAVGAVLADQVARGSVATAVPDRNPESLGSDGTAVDREQVESST